MQVLNVTDALRSGTVFGIKSETPSAQVTRLLNLEPLPPEEVIASIGDIDIFFGNEGEKGVRFAYFYPGRSNGRDFWVSDDVDMLNNVIAPRMTIGEFLEALVREDISFCYDSRRDIPPDNKYIAIDRVADVCFGRYDGEFRLEKIMLFCGNEAFSAYLASTGREAGS